MNLEKYKLSKGFFYFYDKTGIYHGLINNIKKIIVYRYHDIRKGFWLIYKNRL